MSGSENGGTALVPDCMGPGWKVEFWPVPAPKDTKAKDLPIPPVEPSRWASGRDVVCVCAPEDPADGRLVVVVLEVDVDDSAHAIQGAKVIALADNFHVLMLRRDATRAVATLDDNGWLATTLAAAAESIGRGNETEWALTIAFNRFRAAGAEYCCEELGTAGAFLQDVMGADRYVTAMRSYAAVEGEISRKLLEAIPGGRQVLLQAAAAALEQQTPRRRGAERRA